MANLRAGISRVWGPKFLQVLWTKDVEILTDSAIAWPLFFFLLYSSLERTPMLVYTRLSNEAGSNSSPAFGEAAGVVSTARIERPPLHRGGSASTETMPAASPLPSQGARSRSTGPMWVFSTSESFFYHCLGEWPRLPSTARIGRYTCSFQARSSLSRGWGLIGLPLRASNEGLLRPRVARAQKILRLHPVSVLGTQEQRGCFPAPLSFSVSSNGRGESGGFPACARTLRGFWSFILYRGSRQTVLHCAR